jgi:ElaB/YqjD/DUF883 family membrane-anchored ribosome-binding protein
MENGGRGGEGSARERMGEIAGEMQDRLEGMRGYAEDAQEWIRTLARERPWVAIACAAGLGFLIGRLASRT